MISEKWAEILTGRQRRQGYWADGWNLIFKVLTEGIAENQTLLPVLILSTLRPNM